MAPFASLKSSQNFSGQKNKYVARTECLPTKIRLFVEFQMLLVKQVGAVYASKIKPAFSRVTAKPRMVA